MQLHSCGTLPRLPHACACLASRTSGYAQVLAHLRGCGDAEQDPVHFTTAPAAAIPRALAAAGVAAGDVDFYEASSFPFAAASVWLGKSASFWLNP